jgi:hypothetical protein
LNSYIILHCCGSKLSHRDFQLSLIRDLIQEGGRVLGAQIIPQGMPTLSTGWLEAKHVLHWLEKGRRQRCCVPHKRSRVRQFMHIQNAMWHCVSCQVSRYTIQNPCFDTNKLWKKQITHLVSTTSITYWYFFIPTKYWYIYTFLL